MTTSATSSETCYILLLYSLYITYLLRPLSCIFVFLCLLALLGWLHYQCTNFANCLRTIKLIATLIVIVRLNK